MLYANGTIGGKTFKQEVIDPHFLIKTFDIPEFKEAAEFRLTKQRVGKDRFGQPRIPRAINKNPVIQLFSGEHNFTLRYATSATGEGLNMKFRPARMTDLRGRAVSFTKRDIEKYVFYYLHPDHEKSPFADNNSKKDYLIYDAVLEQNRELAAYAAMDATRIEIMTMPLDDLKSKAYGLVISRPGYGNITVSSMKDWPEPQVRAHLRSLLETHKEYFIEKWTSAGSSVLATVHEAIDRGVIVKRKDSMTNGMDAWFYRTGELITIINSGVSPTGAAVDYFSKNYTTKRPELLEAIDKKNVEDGVSQMGGVKAVAQDMDKTLKAAVWQLDTEGLIGEAVGRGVIEFNRADGGVYYTDDGELEETPVYLAEDPKKWRKEFADFLDNGPVQDLNKLRMKLGLKVKE